MKSREVIKAIEAEGWVLVRISGSHHHFRKVGRPGVVTVPHPKAGIATGTLKSIERVTGVRLRKP